MDSCPGCSLRSKICSSELLLCLSDGNRRNTIISPGQNSYPPDFDGFLDLLLCRASWTHMSSVSRQKGNWPTYWRPSLIRTRNLSYRVRAIAQLADRGPNRQERHPAPTLTLSNSRKVRKSKFDGCVPCYPNMVDKNETQRFAGHFSVRHRNLLPILGQQPRTDLEASRLLSLR